ncbi:hypothetical protein LA080_001207 [Diaporthe eres]|nr:hypothetical protein LA080_001207 [Diaporthe eres]
MPSQEAGSNPAPGPSSGAAERQAQGAQGAGAGATSPPRTEQELAQVCTRKSMSSPSKSRTVNLALGYFPQPRVRIFPELAVSDDSDPPFAGPLSISPKTLRSTASCNHARPAAARVLWPSGISPAQDTAGVDQGPELAISLRVHLLFDLATPGSTGPSDKPSGENAATALENNLTTLEGKIDELLASFERSAAALAPAGSANGTDGGTSGPGEGGGSQNSADK